MYDSEHQFETWVRIKIKRCVFSSGGLQQLSLLCNSNMNILPCCDVTFDFKAAKTINPIRIPPTHTPVTLIVERWVHRVALTGLI